MIRKSDVQWWMLEAKKQPESALKIIEELAERLIELDAENERLRDDIIRLQNQGTLVPETTTSRAEVEILQRRVKTLESLLEGEESIEASLVFFSEKGQLMRLPLSMARQMAHEGQPALEKRALLSLRGLLLARPQETLLFVTHGGSGRKLSLRDLPMLERGESWPPEAAGERLTLALAVGEPPRFWTVATQRGYVQRFVRVTFDRRLIREQPLVESPLHKDVPVAVTRGDWGDLLLITRWGRGIRFSHRAIEGQGSMALELERDDQVIAALSLPKDREIIVVTASGRAVRRHTTSFPAKSQPGGDGRRLVQAHDVLAAFPYDPDAQLLTLTYSGKLTFLSIGDLPLQERAVKGTPLRDMSLDPARAMTWVPSDLLGAER